MVAIAAFEAKTHLSALLERVAGGESFTITKHGKPIARLVPIDGSVMPRPAPEIVEDFRRLRESVKPRGGGPSIRELIDEGRRN
jgi:prevent-host-death family protein